jgi:hypothetical protein
MAQIVEQKQETLSSNQYCKKIKKKKKATNNERIHEKG